MANKTKNFILNNGDKCGQMTAIRFYKSPWPFFIPWPVAYILYYTWKLMHGLDKCPVAGVFNLIILFAILFWFIGSWASDLIYETTYRDFYYFSIEKNYTLGFLLFITSEVMLFFGFFWAYYHANFFPTIAIGCQWPPHAIFSDVGLLPALNSYILIVSGISLTWSHRAHLASIRSESLIGLIITIVWGVIFLNVQWYEYKHTTFCINDGIFGSCFYIMTGFHGIHVFIGTILLLIALYRQIGYHFTPRLHFQMKSSIWYWHFVDVVWLFLFLSLYTEIPVI
jgi:heme/copper-type cytochrome/quinol oxidase subunit 3